MAESILDQLAAHAVERVAQAKEICALEEIREAALQRSGLRHDGAFRFEEALRGDEISFICECKKASPSKGVIAEAFPYVEIACEYEAAGADAISVLTEPKWFMGSNEYLRQIAREVSVPCLRKDFTVDEYMIYEAKLLGASAVLLIMSILSEAAVARYLEIADSLGISCLVEAHDAKEVTTAVRAGARVIGVNNRDLRNFTVDISNSIRLRTFAPPEVLFVAESGIQNHEDIVMLQNNGVNGVLIGEALMRAGDKKAMLAALRGETR